MLRTRLPPCAGTRAICARGIRHAGVFGSVSRGKNRPNSDLDIIIDIAPEVYVTLFDYVGLWD
ncbi:MAG TPA: nucleotidyltransferase domain-containing protein [Xanthobacteraceae bacterium]|jgi:hypothetical protein|nr:nucleotidyltransferase domain-containing protein [Xanthobacteraceae bacterium]